MYELRSKWTHVRVSLERMRQALEKILAANDDPPPPLTQVAQRLRLGSAVLYKCHPEACYAISADTRSMRGNERQHECNTIV
jgi:hypothetical protein